MLKCHYSHPDCDLETGRIQGAIANEGSTARSGAEEKAMMQYLQQPTNAVLLERDQKLSFYLKHMV